MGQKTTINSQFDDRFNVILFIMFCVVVFVLLAHCLFSADLSKQAQDEDSYFQIDQTVSSRDSSSSNSFVVK